MIGMVRQGQLQYGKDRPMVEGPREIKDISDSDWFFSLLWQEELIDL